MRCLCVFADAQRLHAGHGRPPDYEARVSRRLSCTSSEHKAECHGSRVYLNFIAGLSCFIALLALSMVSDPLRTGICMVCCTGVCMTHFTIKMVVQV